jgi:dTDP-4-dehydrorhamnose 3,5-epimerase
MKITKTEFSELLVVEPEIFGDERGYFFESWQKEKYTNAGLNVDFIQDNISKSRKGTIRGLHYQAEPGAQDKLCYVISGKVLDVAVDIRLGSPTFGKHYAIELSGENKKQLFLPKGFAHGFSVLSDEAVFMYKVSTLYMPACERVIIYNDTDLAVNWMVENPIISAKDLKGKPFKEIEKDFIY